MLIIAPRAFHIQKLKSRNPDNIDKEVYFKVLVISKDTNGQIPKLKVLNIILFKGVLRHDVTLKDEQKCQ